MAVHEMGGDRQCFFLRTAWDENHMATVVFFDNDVAGVLPRYYQRRFDVPRTCKYISTNLEVMLNPIRFHCKLGL